MAGWKSLHNLNHIDYSMNPVSNSFMFPQTLSLSSIIPFKTDDKYQQSIHMFAIILMTFGIMLLLPMIISQCRQGCQYRSKSETTNRRLTTYARILRIGLGAIALCLIGACFSVGDQINKSLINAEKHFNAIHIPIDKPFHHVDKLIFAVDKLVGQRIFFAQFVYIHYIYSINSID